MGRSQTASLHGALLLVIASWLALIGSLYTAPALAQTPAAESATTEASPPANTVPAERRTARSTMRTFLQAFDPRYARSGQNPLERAASCLDLSQLPQKVRATRGAELAEQLKGILDRVELIRMEDLPDEPEAPPWTLPVFDLGQIELLPDNSGDWRFSAETVASIPTLFQQVENRQKVSGIVDTGPRTIAGMVREKVPAGLRKTGFLLEHWQWLGLLAIIVLGLLVDRLVTSLARAAVRRRLGLGRAHLSTDQLQQITRPLGLLAASLVWSVAIVGLGLPANALAVLVAAVQFLIAISMVWVAYRLVDLLCAVLDDRASSTESRFDDLLVPLLRKSLKVFIVAFGLVFVADALSLPLASVLAGLSISGIALALAAQDMVKNLFGSLTVILDRPFQVGDWVVIGDVEGTVAEVGFRSTRIRTFYDSLITLPNSNLISASVDNYGARTYRRWSTYLALPYDTPASKIEAFCEGVRELVRQHPKTRKDSFHVHLNKLSASSLDVLLYVFFHCPTWAEELEARQALALDILRLGESLGLRFAFPTQTLYLNRDSAPTEGEPGLDMHPPYGPEVRSLSEVARGQAREIAAVRLESAK